MATNDDKKQSNEITLKVSEIEAEFIALHCKQNGMSPAAFLEGLILEKMRSAKVIKPGESPELHLFCDFLANNAHDEVARPVHYLLKHYLEGKRIPAKARVGLQQPPSGYARTSIRES